MTTCGVFALYVHRLHTIPYSSISQEPTPILEHLYVNAFHIASLFLDKPILSEGTLFTPFATLDAPNVMEWIGCLVHHPDGRRLEQAFYDRHFRPHCIQYGIYSNVLRCFAFWTEVARWVAPPSILAALQKQSLASLLRLLETHVPPWLDATEKPLFERELYIWKWHQKNLQALVRTVL